MSIPFGNFSKKQKINIDFPLPLCYYYMAREICLLHAVHVFNIIHTQEYFAIRRRYSPRRVCETQISKNTQAYFGDRRMLRTGFVFDEPLRTPTYSIKFHTQAYRSGHNEAVLKTVCLTGTGVRIPQPAPKNKDTPCGCPLFFASVRGDELSFAKRNGEFAYRRHRANLEAQSICGICVARRY